MEVQVTPARPEDYAEVLVLLAQLWPGRELNRESIYRVYLDNLSSEVQKYYVARNTSGVVGLISVHFINNLWAQGYLMQIEELVVHDTCRGQGIGHLLVNVALTLAAEKGCKSVEVTSAMHREAAHRFYESCGFKKMAYHFIRE